MREQQKFGGPSTVRKRGLMYFSECPRCGDESYEKLITHTYCINCNFSPEVIGEAPCWKRFVSKDKISTQILKDVLRLPHEQILGAGAL